MSPTSLTSQVLLRVFGLRAWKPDVKPIPQTRKVAIMNTRNTLTGFIVASTLGMASGSLAADCSWTRKASMLTGRMFPATSVVNDKVYVIGGGHDILGPHLATVEEYDPATDTWTRKADMPTRRAGLAPSVVNGKIYVIGGEPSAQAFVSTVYAYDPTTDTWTNRTEMPTKRSYLCAATVEDRIYAIGGRAAGDPPDPGPSTLEVYDPATDTWTKKVDMPIRRAAAAACVGDGRIYVIGGVTENFHEAPLSTVNAYDPVTDTWTNKASMLTARAFLSASVLGGKIYAVGGGTWSGDFLTTVEVYDPVTDIWTRGSNMPTSRGGLATSAVNGKIYAIGGTQQWYPGLGMSTVEEYNPTPSVSLSREGGTLRLSWRGILQSTETLDGETWQDLNLPRCPYPISPAAAWRFYRAREP